MRVRVRVRVSQQLRTSRITRATITRASRLEMVRVRVRACVMSRHPAMSRHPNPNPNQVMSRLEMETAVLS